MEAHPKQAQAYQESEEAVTKCHSCGAAYNHCDCPELEQMAKVEALKAENVRLKSSPHCDLAPQGNCGWPVVRDALTAENARLRGALENLVKRLELVHKDPYYQSVWIVAQNHLGPYRGPQYVKELDAARKLLRGAPEGKAAERGDKEARP